MNWMPFFTREIEKIAKGPLSGLLGSATMGGLSVWDLQSTAKQNLKDVQMTPLRQQSQSLQLPGSNQYQFEGSKRIDNASVAPTAMY